MPCTCAFRNEGRTVEIIINKYGIVQQNSFFLKKKRGVYICREKKIVIFSPLLTLRASGARHLLVQFRVVSKLLFSQVQESSLCQWWPGIGTESCQCGFLAERSQLVPQSSFVNWQENKVATWLVRKKKEATKPKLILSSFRDDLHVCRYTLPEIAMLPAFAWQLCCSCTPQLLPPPQMHPLPPQWRQGRSVRNGCAGAA